MRQRRKGDTHDHGCLACALTAGRVKMPDGIIHRGEYWVAEPCVGPLPVGALINKLLRHLPPVWELTESEAAELSPLLSHACGLVNAIASPDQMYVCPWSHAGWQAGRIHLVL